MKDPFEEIAQHIELCAGFENKYKNSWQHEEVIVMFKEFFNEAYQVLPGRLEIIKTVAIGGMIQEHCRTIEMAQIYPRAEEIAKSMAIDWMEKELEEFIHKALYSEN